MHYSYVSASHDFTHLASQGLFLCGTFLASEPLHFASKSVESVHASLYHWSLKNKLTLDLSFFLSGKAYWEIPLVVTFSSLLLFNNIT